MRVFWNGSAPVFSRYCGQAGLAEYDDLQGVAWRWRRWIVEVAYSWFSRFRKPLVRYEKLERSFLTLHHLAAAIIVLRKVPATINIIYG